MAHMQGKLEIKKERIKSIDISKGFSIFWIIGYHISMTWLIDAALWEVEMLYIFFLSTVGPANFLMLSGLNLSLNFNFKKERGWSDRRIYIDILKKIGVLMILSIIYNYLMGFINSIGVAGTEFSWFYSWFSWYIFQIIGISLVLTIFLLRFRKIYRVIISIIIILISYPSYLWLISQGIVGNIFSFFIYYPFPDISWAFPFLPWAACLIIGSVVGDFFYKNMYKKRNSNTQKKSLRNMILYLMVAGLIFIMIAIIFGSSMPIDGYWYDIAMQHVVNLNKAPFFNFISLPYMFLPTHWTYMFYALGIDFLLLSVFTFLSDYKKYKNRIFDALSFSGKYSFSIFIYHHFGLPLFIRTFDSIWGWPAWIGYAVLVIFFIWILVTKFNGIGTIESLMKKKPKSNKTDP
ncbi:MAG: acyltransferase family protein [Candidatus Lokiarchaeota archaeon]|nr:acyltransferase family protein [Candidatus Lokiarchaeota archaeon]